MSSRAKRVQDSAEPIRYLFAKLLIVFGSTHLAFQLQAVHPGDSHQSDMPQVPASQPLLPRATTSERPGDPNGDDQTNHSQTDDPTPRRNEDDVQSAGEQHRQHSGDDDHDIGLHDDDEEEEGDQDDHHANDDEGIEGS